MLDLRPTMRLGLLEGDPCTHTWGLGRQPGACKACILHGCILISPIEE